eukprot:56427-Eustigmatos_ZCMA.PRE.1
MKRDIRTHTPNSATNGHVCRKRRRHARHVRRKRNRAFVSASSACYMSACLQHCAVRTVCALGCVSQ